MAEPKTSKKIIRKKKNLSPDDIARIAIKGAENKKAEDIEMIDVRKSSSISDYIVICTGRSKSQLAAIADGIEESLDKHKIKGYKRHGRADSNWVIVDLIDVVCHIMHKEERDKYDLEELWGKSGITYHV